MPSIATKRLVIRNIHQNDEARFWSLGASRFEIVRWLTGASWPASAQETSLKFQRALSLNFPQETSLLAIDLHGSMIGCVGLETPGDLEQLPHLPTIGYWLGEPFQGKGYAREAVAAALHWGFEVGKHHTFAARVFKDNERSLALLTSLGFHITGECWRYSKSLGCEVENHILQLSAKRFREFAA